MKKTFSIIFILIFYSISVCANVVTGQAAIPDGYYSGVDGKSSAEAILDALFSQIKDHTVISYKSLEPYYEQTDFYADTVWDMYSTCRFTMADANKSQNTVCDAWNKEHSIPQSWFNEGSPMKSDLFHLYPTDARVNNFRSNFPYGEVSGTNGAGFPDNYQNHGLGKKGSNTFPGYTGTVFEPADEYKGDFARTYFYMVARYRDKSLNSSGGSAVFTTNKTNLTEFAKNLFLKWHRADPVSQKEIDRNQAVYGIQHNRNPFIDYPELAEYIWGEKAGQRIDLATMTPTCEGGGGGVIVPEPAVMYGVTWSANGANLYVDSVAEGKSLKALPEAPASCSAESNTFVGWTNRAISGIAGERPAVLYTKAAEFPAVTADVTYYAVFAKATVTGSGAPAVYTFDADHQAGWSNSASNKNGYWLLEEGKVLVSPEVDLSGLESITVNMRTYGGTQYKVLDVKAGTTTVAQLEASAGSTLKDYTWTNTATLVGRSPLTFSSSYGSGKGVGFASVTIRATGASTTYSRFITACQTATEVIDGSVDGDKQAAARKILVGGQIYILLGNQLYNIQGQRIK